MWRRLREVVEAEWPSPPGDVSADAYLADVDASKERDAYHSLSIEGYRVTPELISRVRSGNWSPDIEPDDARRASALAAAGYLRTFDLVRDSLSGVLRGDDAGETAERDLHTWYRGLFHFHVQVGILESASLVGYRTHPIYIRGSRHVPPRHSALSDAMDAFFRCLKDEESAAVRALLGHFMFTWIHPFTDGNGRLGRFLMNLQLGSAGYPWTVLRVERRTQYMESLERGSSDDDIAPFARFVLGEMEAGST